MDNKKSIPVGKKGKRKGQKLDSLYNELIFGEELENNEVQEKIPVTIDQAPTFHAELCDIMNVVSTKKINAKIAVAAPRSHDTGFSYDLM